MNTVSWKYERHTGAKKKVLMCSELVCIYTFLCLSLTLQKYCRGEQLGIYLHNSKTLPIPENVLD